MSKHNWIIETIDAGHLGADDFWICRTCGLSGGGAGPFFGEDKPKQRFLAGAPLDFTKINADDCALCYEHIERFVSKFPEYRSLVTQARSGAIRSDTPEFKDGLKDGALGNPPTNDSKEYISGYKEGISDQIRGHTNRSLEIGQGLNCAHNKEMPLACPCKEDCYCRISGTCTTGLASTYQIDAKVISDEEKLSRLKERIDGLYDRLKANYSGGYREESELEIYQHGMWTAINTVKKILETL